MATGSTPNISRTRQKAFAPQGVEEGNGILGHLFGSKELSRAVAAQAAQATGIGQQVLQQMLPVIASMVMGGLFKQSTNQLQAGQAAAWRRQQSARRDHRADDAARRRACAAAAAAAASAAAAGRSLRQPVRQDPAGHVRRRRGTPHAARRSATHGQSVRQDLDMLAAATQRRRRPQNLRHATTRWARSSRR